MFKTMPKERCLRVGHIYKILSVNLKLRLNVGGNAI